MIDSVGRYFSKPCNKSYFKKFIMHTYEHPDKTL
jgi:hypothetical protein